jgi:4-hydroxy-tetrahydrodipicolinate synthase
MKAEKKYCGVVVPMMTPFTAAHTVDSAAAAKLADHVVAAKAHPFILGTTGEAVSIPHKQRKDLVSATVKATGGRALVYVGISGNSQQDALEEGKRYHDLGADVLVTTMPSYYPVSPDQMLRYLESLANGLPCPLIIYNIPATTHLSIPLEVVDKLSAHPNIAGFKDSEKGVERISAAAALWKDRQDFSYLLGWALMSQSALEQGADGIVPSTGNLAPVVYQRLYEAARAGDAALAALAQQKADRISAMYQKDRILSDSLSAFKAMLAGYGLCGPDVLPPLYRLPASAEKQLVADVRSQFGDLDQINSIDHEQ